MHKLHADVRFLLVHTGASADMRFPIGGYMLNQYEITYEPSSNTHLENQSYTGAASMYWCRPVWGHLKSVVRGVFF